MNSDVFRFPYNNPAMIKQTFTSVVSCQLLDISLKTNNQQLTNKVGKGVCLHRAPVYNCANGTKTCQKIKQYAEYRTQNIECRARLQPCETISKPKGLPYILSTVCCILKMEENYA